MSWPTWTTAAGPPIPSVVAGPPISSTLLPTALNSAPAVLPPNLQYSQEQWAQAQQQNWQQWAQWQQQYQQWHQQYGAEYQKSMSALQGAPQPLVQPAMPTLQPPLPGHSMAVAPPLPLDNKPPLPPEEPPANQPSIPSYTTAPPKPVQTGYNTAPPPLMGQQPPHVQPPPAQAADPYGRQNWGNAQKRPGSRGNAFDGAKKPSIEGANQWDQPKPGAPWQQYSQPPPQAAAPKPVVEELSEAEKKFDKEFAAWEAQFNKWKDQNVNHPDKTQYREYEKKWESWRNSLLERREQMRRKRIAMSSQAAVVTETSKPQTFSKPPPVQQPPTSQQAPPAQPRSLQTPSSSQPFSAQRPPLGAKPGLLGAKPSLLGPGPQIPSNNQYGTPAAGASKETDNFFNKPPPNQNNEPLSFNKPPSYPVAEETESAGNSFLQSGAASTGGIPGLDLVQEDDKAEDEPDNEVIELDKEQKRQEQEPQQSKRPDLDAISKGINSILGDQKLLNMLSMVSQNAPPSTQGVNFNAPPLLQQPHQTPPQDHGFNPSNIPNNEYSKQSYDDRSNQDDYYQQREAVNNFDDQTRSSFTMGPNDNQGMRNRGPPPGRQEMFAGHPDMYGPPPDRFGNPQEKFGGPHDRFSGPPPQDNRNNFGPGGSRMDQYGGAPPQDKRNFGMGGPRNAPDNYGGPPPQNRNFGPSGNRGFGRDNFESKGGGNFNDGFDDNFRRDEFQSDNYNNDNFRKDKFGGGPRNNFGMGGDNRNDRFGGNYEDDAYDQEDDDYEDYHRRFIEEDEYQEEGYEEQDMRGPPPPHIRPNIPSLMDQIAPAPPHIRGHPPSMNAQPPPMNMEPMPPNAQPPPLEKEILFEPAQLIDYEHKPLTPPEPDVAVEPPNMFDYHHKPLNQILLMERPRWLVEEVKFIREFDFLPPRYDKPVERFAPSRIPRDIDFGSRDRDFGPRDRDFVGRGRDIALRDRDLGVREFDYQDMGPRDSERYNRGRAFEERDRGNDRDYEYGRRDRLPDRDNSLRDDFDDRGARFERNRHSRGRSQEDARGKSEGLRLNKHDFEDLSDDDMDWEQGEQKRHKRQQDDRRSKSKSPPLSNPPNPTAGVAEITMIEDIINPPERANRPPRIVIILRGPPGSGKTFLARLIKDKEVENGGSAPRILSLDDYFMVEHERRVMEDGRVQTIKEMVYEYEAEMEDSYRASFLKSFKKTITDGYFPFVIVDTVNDKVKHFGEMWSFAKQNGFQVYICQLDLDPVQCTKRNIHNRTEAEIEECIAGWEPTPSHHPTIDVSGLLQFSGISEVEMEVEDEHQQIDNQNAREEQAEDDAVQGRDHVRSKWDTFDCSSNNLAKLDGVSKPLRKERTMEEFLQLEDEWQPTQPTKSGKKRVRWADLEEQREQEKMRKIGFVVGHTNWGRMMDPTGGSSALTKTKYI